MNYFDCFDSEEERHEVAMYGLRQGGRLLFGVAVLLLAGFLIGILPDTLLFFVVAYSMRIYAGGFHAATEKNCTWISAITSALVLFAMKWLVLPGPVMAVLTVLAGICIWILAPIDTANKRLEEEEKELCGKKCKMRLVFWGCLFALALKLHFHAIAICYAMLFVAGSVAAGWILVRKKVQE